MSLEVLVTPSFARTVKKLQAPDKKILDEAVAAVAANPSIGEAKKGDLVGIFVYKFKLNKRETLLAYQLQPDKYQPTAVALLAVGPHENFYTHLKR